jgi:hypothetical protein
LHHAHHRRTTVVEQRAPGALAQQAVEVRVPAHEDESRFVQQRGRITAAAALVGRGAGPVLHVAGVECRFRLRKREPYQRVQCVMPLSAPDVHDAVMRDRGLVGERAGWCSVQEPERLAIRQREARVESPRVELRELR